MSERLLAVASLAFVIAAAGLLLMLWVIRREARAKVRRHLAHQIAAGIAKEEAAYDVRQAAASNTTSNTAAKAATRLTVDPWANVSADSPAPRKSGIDAIALPGWLEGAVTVRLLGAGVLAILALSAIAFLVLGRLAAAGAFAGFVLLGVFAVWLRVQKFRRTLVHQLPAFIDSMVRLIAIGNATHAAFQLSVGSARPPLRGYMEGASSLVRAGVDLDHALHQMARHVHIEEMDLLASILGVGVRFGGRADVLLERVANFMRDHEQAEHELSAMSAETRLSAWILGLLPVCVGLAIFTLNPTYFAHMWRDASGQMMIFGAFGLQAVGVLLLYRLARLA